MAWAGGTELMRDIIHVLKKEIRDKTTREIIYLKMIDSFEKHAWDKQQECLGEDDAFDIALEKLHSPWFKKDAYTDE